MNYEVIIPISLFIISVVGIGIRVYTLSLGQPDRMYKKYEFAKQFLAEVEQKPTIHPFLYESGYQAIAGNNTLRAEEVKYLLSLKDPDIALKGYGEGKKYLEYLPCVGNLKINWKGKYQYWWVRQGYQCGYLFLSGLFLVSMGLPYIFPGPYLSQPPTSVFFIYAIWPLFCLACVELIFKKLRGLSAAERLVKSQAKHTQYIVVKNTA